MIAIILAVGLGSAELHSSCAPAAQKDILRGELLLHSFMYEASREAFQAAQKKDAQCAIAWWGEAMTWDHPLWGEADLPAGALQRDRSGVGLFVAIEHPENAFRRGEPALDRGIDARQRFQALEQRQQRDKIRPEQAEIQLAGLALRQRYPDDARDGERGQDLRQRRARSAGRRLLGHRIAQICWRERL